MNHFYGFYLANTDIDHPGRKEVLRSMETDWDTVSKSITGFPPNGEKVWFQKHMAQHNLPGVDLSWTSLVINCFLIRDPREVIISYHKKYDVNRAELLGYPQQVELYRMLTEKDCVDPTIVDAKDILKDPEGMLEKGVHRNRNSVHGRDAFLVGRTKRNRWCLGKVLVQQSRGINRVPAVC